MTIVEKIEVLCVRCGVSRSELARRLGRAPQSFHAKLKRGSFDVDDLNEIASALNVEYKGVFVLPNGEEI